MNLKKMFGKILCKAGIHDWGKKFGYDQHSSNVIEWKQRCTRCGTLKQWVEAKSADYGKRKSR
jgi:hypothetical protein